MIYHTGKERQAVGTATVTSVERRTPKRRESESRREGNLEAPHSGRDQRTEFLPIRRWSDKDACRSCLSPASSTMAHQRLARLHLSKGVVNPV